MTAHTYTPADVERIAKRLGGTPKACRCPAHDDRRASLSLGLGDDGTLLWCCHAGCSQEAVLDALKGRGLLLNGDARETKPNGHDRRRIVATYDYTDESGTLLFQVIRYHPKDFRQRRPAGNGAWAWSIEGVRRVLFRLPDVLAAEDVVVVEGEKDALNLEAVGFVATTAPGGGGKGKWLPGYTEALAGKHVTVIGDNDATGRAHARKVAGELVGRAASVRLVRLEGAKDPSDWLAAGHTADELRELIAKAPKAEAGDGRVRITLAAERHNENLRQAAGLLADIVFMRGTVPVVLAAAEEAGGRRDGEEIELRGVRHRPGSLILTEATSGLLRYKIDERALFLRYDGRAKETVAGACPERFSAQLVDAAILLGFRPCAGISHVPLLTPGGLVAEPGYHDGTGLVLDLSTRQFRVPGKPTKVDAVEALERLLRPFRGYLDNGAVDKPSVAAAALTAALRPSLPTAPAIIMDGNSPGVGKGKFGRALATLATGHLPAVVTEGHDHSELEKRLAAAIVQGAPVVMLDNLQRKIASSTLESAITEPVASIRLFGQLKEARVACRALFLITANQAAMRRDLLRRLLRIRIVVRHPTPETRPFDFDPVAEVARDRHELLEAAFTAVKAWRLARDLTENRAHRKTLGSFEQWADDVAGLVSWTLGKHPVDLIQENAEAERASDPATLLIDAIETWQNRRPVEEGKEQPRWPASEAVAGVEAEHWALAKPGADKKLAGDKPNAHQAANWLKGRRDAVFGSRILTAERDAAANNLRWRIDRMPAPDDPQGTDNERKGSKTSPSPGSPGHGTAGTESIPPRKNANNSEDVYIDSVDNKVYAADSAPAVPCPGEPGEVVPPPESDLAPPPSAAKKPKAKAKPAPVRETPPTVDLVIHATAEDARRALADKAERGVLCGVDYETVSLKPRTGELRLVQVAEEGRPVDVIDVRACGGPAAFADLLGRVRGIAHNALYELGWNRAMGVDNNLHCTKVAARVVEGYDEDDDDEPDEAGPRKRRRRDYGLAAVAKRHLGVTMVKEGWQKGDWAGELERGHYDYAAADPVACLRLWRLFHPAMQADGSYEAYRVAIDAQPAVADMRERGVLIDREAHEALMAGIAEDAERLGRAFEEATGVTNLLSPPQLGTWLEERLRDCPKDLRDAWKRGKNGLPSTDKRTVASLVGRLPPDVGRIVVELLVPGRGARHSLANYGPKLAEMLEKEGDGRIRAEFQVASTASGRMSCNDPNLQQIPREGRYRRLVVAPPGRSLVTADYSQIELRLAAARAGEGTMLALLDDPAADLHRHTAAALFGVPEGGVTKEQRQQAKTFNFGLIYSMGATKLRENLALVGVLVTQAEAERLRKRWFDAYPAFRDWQDTSLRDVRRMADPEVRTKLGRPRRFPKRGIRAGVVFNHPVQGTGAEGLYLALAELRERLREDGLDAVPVIANHDEIVLEASDEDAEEAARILEDAMRNGMLEVAPDLPSQGLVEAKVGKSWADKR